MAGPTFLSVPCRRFAPPSPGGDPGFYYYLQNNFFAQADSNTTACDTVKTGSFISSQLCWCGNLIASEWQVIIFAGFSYGGTLGSNSTPGTVCNTCASDPFWTQTGWSSPNPLIMSGSDLTIIDNNKFSFDYSLLSGKPICSVPGRVSAQCWFQTSPP